MLQTYFIYCIIHVYKPTSSFIVQPFNFLACIFYKKKSAQMVTEKCIYNLFKKKKKKHCS